MRLATTLLASFPTCHCFSSVGGSAATMELSRIQSTLSTILGFWTLGLKAEIVDATRRGLRTNSEAIDDLLGIQLPVARCGTYE